MTKAEIAQWVVQSPGASLYKVNGLSRKETIELVDLVFETMKEALGRGENIKVTGFGKFVLRDKGQRIGRNPRTGQPMTIGSRRILTFKASPILRQALHESP